MCKHTHPHLLFCAYFLKENVWNSILTYKDASHFNNDSDEICINVAVLNDICQLIHTLQRFASCKEVISLKRSMSSCVSWNILDADI